MTTDAVASSTAVLTHGSHPQLSSEINHSYNARDCCQYISCKHIIAAISARKCLPVLHLHLGLVRLALLTDGRHLKGDPFLQKLHSARGCEGLGSTRLRIKLLSPHVTILCTARVAGREKQEAPATAMHVVLLPWPGLGLLDKVSRDRGYAYTIMAERLQHTNKNHATVSLYCQY